MVSGSIRVIVFQPFRGFRCGVFHRVSRLSCSKRLSHSPNHFALIVFQPIRGLLSFLALHSPPPSRHSSRVTTIVFQPFRGLLSFLALHSPPPSLLFVARHDHRVPTLSRFSSRCSLPHFAPFVFQIPFTPHVSFVRTNPFAVFAAVFFTAFRAFRVPNSLTPHVSLCAPQPFRGFRCGVLYRISRLSCSKRLSRHVLTDHPRSFFERNHPTSRLPD